MMENKDGCTLRDTDHEVDRPLVGVSEPLIHAGHSDLDSSTIKSEVGVCKMCEEERELYFYKDGPLCIKCIRKQMRWEK